MGGCKTEFLFKIMEVDHVVPRSRGGSDHPENLQLLCPNCNRIKGDRDMAYLVARLGESDDMEKKLTEEEKLKKGLIAVLEDGIEAQIPEPIQAKGDLSTDERAKYFHLLRDSGYIIYTEEYGNHTSLSGREYLYRLKHSLWAQIKRNCFPVVVAAATILLAAVSSGVQLTALLTSNSGSSMGP